MRLIKIAAELVPGELAPKNLESKPRIATKSESGPALEPAVQN